MSSEILHIGIWSSEKEMTNILNLFGLNDQLFIFYKFDPSILNSIQITSNNYNLLIVDLEFIDTSLSKLLELLRAAFKTQLLRVIFLTNDWAIYKDIQINSINFIDILEKPLNHHKLKFKIIKTRLELLSVSMQIKHLEFSNKEVKNANSNFSTNIDKLAFQLVNQITENIQHQIGNSGNNVPFKPNVFDALVDAIPNPIYIKDEGGRYLKINKAFENLLKINNDQIRYKTVFDLVSFDKARKYQQLDLTAFKNNEASIVNETIDLGNNTSREMLIIRSPVSLSFEERKNKAMLGMMIDVTEKQQAEKYLKIQRELEYNAWFQGGLRKSLKYILSKLTEIDWVDGGGIYLFDEHQVYLKLIFSQGLDPQFVKQVQVYSNESNQARMVLAGKPHYSHFNALESKLKSSTKFNPFEFKISAVLPLKHNQKVIGSLNVVSRKIGSLIQNDKLAIEAMAAKIGSVIAYLKATEELEEHKEKLELKVAERTKKLKRLNEKLSHEVAYHKKTKQALNRSEKLYRGIFNNAHDCIILYDTANRKIIDFNRKTQTVFGYTRKEFEKISPLDFLYFETKEEQEKLYQKIYSKTEFVTHLRTKTKTGIIKYNILSTRLLNINGEGYVLAVLHDITELKRATKELVKSEKKIRELQDNVSIGMFRLDERLNLIYMNPFARRLLKIGVKEGYGELKMSDFNVTSGDIRKFAKKLLKKKSLRNIKRVVKRHDGSSFYANINLTLSTDEKSGTKAIDVTMEDVSAVKKAQEELKNANQQIRQINKSLEERIKRALEKQKRNQAYIIQKSKLESLGELASGVAHEINQPLGVMSLAFENLQSKFIAGQTDTEYLLQKFKSIDENIERIRNIIDQVRTFSRDDPPLMIQKVFINNCVRNVLKLIGTQYENHGVNLRLDLDENIGFTIGSRTRLEQVIMNLLSNSKYAVDEFADYFNSSDYQKKIKISTGFIGKNQVYLSVEDNGIGIEKANLDKVFDPFYTTKPSWKGTGLGLSIVYGILNEMRAEISVESEPEKFTRFTITFPMYPEKY